MGDARGVTERARGVGLAVRLLSAFQATVEKLNLHPDLKKLVKHPHGLILVCGPTGCGTKSCGPNGCAAPQGMPGTLVFPQNPYVRSPRDFFMWEAGK